MMRNGMSLRQGVARQATSVLGIRGQEYSDRKPMKPGSCGPGVIGIYPVIYDEERNELKAGSGKAGNICIRNPWPGIFRSETDEARKLWPRCDRYLSSNL